MHPVIKTIGWIFATIGGAYLIVTIIKLIKSKRNKNHDNEPKN